MSERIALLKRRQQLLASIRAQVDALPPEQVEAARARAQDSGGLLRHVRLSGTVEEIRTMSREELVAVLAQAGKERAR